MATTESEHEVVFEHDKTTRHLTHVGKPTLEYFPVTDSKSPTPIVIVCPGGGYRILAYDKEGIEVAQWLNSIGIAAVVLKYRVPDNREGALLDALESLRFVRSKTKAWNIDPNKVGMLGFSAGAHLAAAASHAEVRPDFTILVYPAYLFKSGTTEITDEIKVDSKTPPAFVVQTKDDIKYYRSSIAYTTALDAGGIPVELHLFAKGGHGYGLRPSTHPVSRWPSLCADWLREMEFLKK